MNEVRCECQYCGNRWSLEGVYSWRSSSEACSKCGEKKLITRREVKLETGDVFGYRFSPEFPRKSSF